MSLSPLERQSHAWYGAGGRPLPRLLQDFWTGANGILDTYYVSKHPPAELDEIRTMNAAVVLLVAEPGDNLPMPDNSSRLQRAYSSNETLETSLHISNYGAADIPAGATLRWSVVASGGGGGGGGGSSNRTVCEHSAATRAAIPQGPGTTWLADISCNLPDLGDFANPAAPLTLSISAKLEPKSSNGNGGVSNAWRSRVYAAATGSPPAAAVKGRTLYAQTKFCGYLPPNAAEHFVCGIPAADGLASVPPGAVFVVDYLDETILQVAAAGATVVFNGNSTTGGSQMAGTSAIQLETDAAVFKTAWWLGNAADNNMGTVACKIVQTSPPCSPLHTRLLDCQISFLRVPELVLLDKLTVLFPTDPGLETIAPGMTPDGWADEGWCGGETNPA